MPPPGRLLKNQRKGVLIEFSGTRSNIQYSIGGERVTGLVGSGDRPGVLLRWSSWRLFDSHSNSLVASFINNLEDFSWPWLPARISNRS